MWGVWVLCLEQVEFGELLGGGKWGRYRSGRPVYHYEEFERRYKVPLSGD
jgi:hypothetical protein